MCWILFPILGKFLNDSGAEWPLGSWLALPSVVMNGVLDRMVRRTMLLSQFCHLPVNYNYVRSLLYLVFFIRINGLPTLHMLQFVASIQEQMNMDSFANCLV